MGLRLRRNAARRDRIFKERHPFTITVSGPDHTVAWQHN
jgi:hypothetical protein